MPRALRPAGDIAHTKDGRVIADDPGPDQSQPWDQDPLLLYRQPDAPSASTAMVTAAGEISFSAATAILMTSPTSTVAATAVTNANAVTDNSEVKALRVDVARANYTVPGTGAVLDGTGLKIGILSDSFNLDGAAAGDEADGDLPPASQVDIVREGPTGSGDEGRAMAELIHKIAPGASIYFYTASDSEADFANGITTLANMGMNVIVDDVSYTDESFYQNTGTITQAVEAAIAKGIDYFTAAGNESNNYYEAAFSPTTVTLAGIGTVSAHNVGNGSGGTSVYEAVTLKANAGLDFTLEWTQPYATGQGTGTKYDIGVAIYDQGGNLVANYTTSDLRGNPVLSEQVTLSNSAGVYNLVFYESAGTVTPGTFKLIFFQDSNATFTGLGAGVGSGSSIGHQIAPGVNTVSAVNYAETPAYGVSTPVVESFSSYGPGETYINSAGVTLATPISHGGPQFAAADGSPTDVYNPFNGTSAAAPEAAAVSLLLLQADSRLSTTQITYALTRSAVATASAVNGGAGLIQADVAVGEAVTAATTPEWQGASGSGTGNWSTAADWTDGIVPRSTDAVVISNGLGAISASYTLTYDPIASTIASLDVDGLAAGLVADLRIASGHGLTVTGDATVGSGVIEVAGALTVGGALVSGALAGTAIRVESGTLTVGGGEGLAITYVGTGGDVVLTASDSTTLTTLFTGGINNFSSGATLDLSGLSFNTGLGVFYDSVNADIYQGSTSDIVAKVALAGSFTQLRLQQDGGTGTEIVACYVRGTRIETLAGEVAVEDLREGDRVVTLDGRAKPIVWIGRRGYAGRFLAGKPALLPIRIRAGALAEGVPRRDLLVSPMHAMYLDGVLVPAVELVNGVSIVQEMQAGQVEYFHIELAAHDVILAEGAHSETFVDDDSRGVFHNAGEYWQAHPDARPAPARYCAPRCDHGHALEDLRRRLAARAGIAAAAAPLHDLRGAIERIGPTEITGWAHNPAFPDAPVCIDVLLQGRLLRQVLANQSRPDLLAAGIGSGRNGFSIALPANAEACQVELRTTLDQRQLQAA